MCKVVCLRVFSFFLIIFYFFSFCFPSGLYAKSQLCFLSSQKTNVAGPMFLSEIAFVKETFQGSENSPHIYFIQDAHANYQAQRKIYQIIKTLNSNHFVEHVFLEGLVGEVDVSLFKAFPLKDVKKRLIEAEMKNGAVTGAENFAINSETNVQLYGVENELLYVEHVKTYVEILQFKDVTKKWIASQEKELNDLIKGKPLAFLSKKRSFLNGKCSLSDYLNSVFLLMHKCFSDNEIWALENTVNKRGIEGCFFSLFELCELIEDEKCFSENENQIIECLKVLNNLEIESLSQELKFVESKIEEKIIGKNPEHKAVYSRLKRFEKLERILMLRALPEDIADLNNQEFLNNVKADASVLAHVFDLIVKYYGFANQRESYFINNLIENIKEHKFKTAALIAGGYHTRGIKQMLQERGISYSIITPRLTENPEENHYEKIIAGYSECFGVLEGERGGTVQIFDSIVALQETDANKEQVEKLRKRLLPQLVGALMEQPDVDELIKRWNENTTSCAISRLGKTSKDVFFMETDEFIELLEKSAEKKENFNTLWRKIRLGILNGKLGRMVSPAKEGNGGAKFNKLRYKLETLPADEVAEIGPIKVELARLAEIEPNPYGGHVYDVGRHSLEALKTLDWLSKIETNSEIAERFLLEAYNYVKKNNALWMLRLAVLLHDVGKTKEPVPYLLSHTSRGAYEVLPNILENLGIVNDSYEAKVVKWLVLNHHLADFIRIKRDFASVDTINELVFLTKDFAEDKKTLVIQMLFLISYSDLIAINLMKKNSAAIEMYNQFFFRVINAIESGNVKTYESFKQEKYEWLRGCIFPKGSVSDENVEAYVHLMPDYTLLDHRFRIIKEHLNLLENVSDVPKIGMHKIQKKDYSNCVEIVVGLKLDAYRIGLGSILSAVMLLHGFDVSKNETRSHFAGNVIWERFVCRTSNGAPPEALKAKKEEIEGDIQRLFKGQCTIEELFKEKGVEYDFIDKKDAPNLIIPEIEFDVDQIGQDRMFLKASDRVGLLHFIARILNDEFSIGIKNAYINTLGYIADDMFYLNTDEVIFDDAMKAKLTRRLCSVLGGTERFETKQVSPNVIIKYENLERGSRFESSDFKRVSMSMQDNRLIGYVDFVLSEKSGLIDVVSFRIEDDFRENGYAKLMYEKFYEFISTSDEVVLDSFEAINVMNVINPFLAKVLQDNGFDPIGNGARCLISADRDDGFIGVYFENPAAKANFSNQIMLNQDDFSRFRILNAPPENLDAVVSMFVSYRKKIENVDAKVVLYDQKKAQELKDVFAEIKPVVLSARKMLGDKQRCASTAIVVAEILNKKGFDVKIAKGNFICKEELREHVIVSVNVFDESIQKAAEYLIDFSSEQFDGVDYPLFARTDSLLNYFDGQLNYYDLEVFSEQYGDFKWTTSFYRAINYFRKNGGEDIVLLQPVFDAWLQGESNYKEVLFEARKRNFSVISFMDEKTGMIKNYLPPFLARYTRFKGLIGDSLLNEIKRGFLLWRETGQGFEFFLFDYAQDDFKDAHYNNLVDWTYCLRCFYVKNGKLFIKEDLKDEKLCVELKSFNFDKSGKKEINQNFSARCAHGFVPFNDKDYPVRFSMFTKDNAFGIIKPETSNAPILRGSWQWKVPDKWKIIKEGDFVKLSYYEVYETISKYVGFMGGFRDDEKFQDKLKFVEGIVSEIPSRENGGKFVLVDVDDVFEQTHVSLSAVKAVEILKYSKHPDNKLVLNVFNAFLSNPDVAASIAAAYYAKPVDTALDATFENPLPTISLVTELKDLLTNGVINADNFSIEFLLEKVEIKKHLPESVSSEIKKAFVIVAAYQLWREYSHLFEGDNGKKQEISNQLFVQLKLVKNLILSKKTFLSPIISEYFENGFTKYSDNVDVKALRALLKSAKERVFSDQWELDYVRFLQKECLFAGDLENEWKRINSLLGQENLNPLFTLDTKDFIDDTRQFFMPSFYNNSELIFLEGDKDVKKLEQDIVLQIALMNIYIEWVRRHWIAEDVLPEELPLKFELDLSFIKDNLTPLVWKGKQMSVDKRPVVEMLKNLEFSAAIKIIGGRFEKHVLKNRDLAVPESVVKMVFEEIENSEYIEIFA